MPLTFLHVVYVWYILRRMNKFNLHVVVGCMVPDLEILILYILGFGIPRSFLHSPIGAFILAPAISILIIYILLKTKFMEKVFNVNVIRRPKELREYVNLWIVTGLSSLTHVFIDYLHHSYNPILWPIYPIYIEGPIAYLIGYLNATLVVHLASVIILVIILVYASWKMRTSILKIITSLQKMYKVFVEPGSLQFS
ncbi:MAG: DUF4184 family protein [Nitrososphaerota archaeon]